MKFYLKIINPVIALLALILCTWAAVFNDKTVALTGIVAGGFSSYFFAKGLYTSASLYVLGRILLEFLYGRSEKHESNSSKSDVAYIVAFLTFSIGSLAGLYFWGSSNKSTESTSIVKNPSGLIVTESYPIRQSEKLKIGGVIRNSSDTEYDGVKVLAKLYLGNKYSGINSTTINEFKQKCNEDFLIEFNDFPNQNIKDSIRYEIVLEANAVGSNKK